MKRCVAIVGLVLVVTFLAPRASAQEPPPSGPFKTVHLNNLTPEQATALLAWMADVNAMIARAGHKDTRYRLYKVAGKQSGTYAYLWESTWAGGDVYTKVHQSPEWQAINKKHAGLDVLKDQIYNRYVEVVAR